MAPGALIKIEDVLDRLGTAFAPVKDIFSEIWPPVVAVIAITVLLRLARNAFLLWRSRSSRVQVSSFAWASSDSTHDEATWVTSLFREQLAALRLDALDPLPERAPGAPLVEIVEGVGQGVSRDIGAAAGRLYKALVPDSGYEVWGTLRPREEGGGRISIQLIERRRGNRTLLNVALEPAGWEEGAREAALAVAGALYPRVREGDRGPWALWKKSVPIDVVRAYHDARRYEHENRLEHALDCYQRALEQDPLNPNLRLKIAMLQERLELDLDAWVTYEAIVDEKNPRAWPCPNRRVYLLALYRIAVILTNGRIAEQWLKGTNLPTAKRCKRDEERQGRREELRMSLERDPLFTSSLSSGSSHLTRWLKGRLPQLIVLVPAKALMGTLCQIEAAASRDKHASSASDQLDPFRDTRGDEQEREQRIEAVLQVLALRRLEEFETALGLKIPRWETRKEAWIRRPKLRRIFNRREFSLAAGRASRLLVRTRIVASFERRLDHWPGDEDAQALRHGWLAGIRADHRNLLKHWPYPASSWQETVHWLSPRRRWANSRADSWQLHYNAACALASILRKDSALRTFQAERKAARHSPGQENDADIESLNPLPDGTEEEDLVRRAIEELEEYAYRAGSDRVASHAEWVACDDPDFEGLREEKTFRLWAKHHLPPRVRQGQPARKSDIKRFTIRVMQEGAGVFALVWRERATETRPQAAELVQRWQAEAEIWKALGKVCREHLSWEERLRWLEILKLRLQAVQTDRRIDFSHKGRAKHDLMSEVLFGDLAELAGGNGNGAGPVRAPADVHTWAHAHFIRVRDAYEAGEERADLRGDLKEKDEHREALRAARIWTRLSELLARELGREEASDDELRKDFDNLRRQLA